jgi:hypothetical protein
VLRRSDWWEVASPAWFDPVGQRSQGAADGQAGLVEPGRPWRRNGHRDLTGSSILLKVSPHHLQLSRRSVIFKPLLGGAVVFQEELFIRQQH